MKVKLNVSGSLLLGLALFSTLSISARSGRDGAQNVKAPVELIGVIAIPGNPLIDVDIAWPDPGTKRIYFADRSNFGVDIIDAENHLFVGRIGGFAGSAAATPAPPNGVGPSGVLVTPGKKLWSGDGNSTVKVADVDPTSPNYLKIIESISTAIPECGAHCNRADEIGYDAADHIIVIANDRPTAPTPPFGPSNPYATFISADTYKVLGTVTFEGATGLEQPVWDPELHRIFITVPGYRNGGGSNAGFGEVAVIDPKTMKVTQTYKPGNCHASGETLGPSQHLLVSCGGPVIMNALNGKIISTITQVGGGDEVWYNPGDRRFYVTANDKSTPPVTSLGVIDAETGAWLQNVPDPGGRQAVAFAENNHIFTPVRLTPAIVSDPSTDKTTCSLFGFKGTGCVAVFAHSEPSHAKQK